MISHGTSPSLPDLRHSVSQSLDPFMMLHMTIFHSLLLLLLFGSLGCSLLQGTGAWREENTHLHHAQSPQEAIQSHKDQRGLEIPLSDFLVLFEVRMEILPSVLKQLLEEAQGVHDHMQFPLTVFDLTAQEVFWAEINRGLEGRQVSGTKPGCRCKDAPQLCPAYGSSLSDCPCNIFQKPNRGNIRPYPSVPQRDWDLGSSYGQWQAQGWQVTSQRQGNTVRLLLGQLGLDRQPFQVSVVTHWLSGLP